MIFITCYHALYKTYSSVLDSSLLRQYRRNYFEYNVPNPTGFHDNNDGNGGDKTNKDKTDADQKNNGGDKDNTQTIIIVVCVLVVLLLTGLVVFVIYKYRNR
jgi:hypothetical protein